MGWQYHVLAERYQGKPLNAPNDLVALPSNGIIFTNPGYGAHFDYEGSERELELETAIYYVDDEPMLLSEEGRQTQMHADAGWSGHLCQRQCTDPLRRAGAYHPLEAGR